MACAPTETRSSRRPPATTPTANTIASSTKPSAAGKRPVEDAVFGFRAAGPALLANVSYFERRICGWDAEKMEAV